MVDANIITKQCSKCGSPKPLADFYKQAGCVLGLRPDCKACTRSRTSAYAAANRDECAERDRAYYLRHAERIAARERASYTKNKERRNELSKIYQQKHKDRLRPMIAANGKAWREKNRDLCRLYDAAHRAQKLKATPGWSSRDEILEFYEDAYRLSRETGYSWEVDHIVPLQSKLVCGLHWAANLRVIPLFENRSKGNKYWPDMPG